MHGIRWFVCLLGLFYGFLWVNFCLADDNFCQNVLDDAVVFAPQQRRPTLSSRLYFTRGQRFKLGRGNYGRVVKVASRLSPEQVYVEKIYWEPKFLPSARAFLQALSLTQNRYGPFSFRVIEVLGEKSPKTLMMEYIEGRDLHSLMIDRNIPEEIKDELAVIYVAKLEAFKEQLQTRLGILGVNMRMSSSGHYRDRIPDDLPYLSGTDLYGQPSTEVSIDPNMVPGRLSPEDKDRLRQLRFLVHSANVIVSPTRDENGLVQMTLVDLD